MSQTAWFDKIRVSVFSLAWTMDQDREDRETHSSHKVLHTERYGAPRSGSGGRGSRKKEYLAVECLRGRKTGGRVDRVTVVPTLYMVRELRRLPQILL